MHLLLIVNSFASSVTARNTVVVHQLLSREHDVELVETNRRGHAIRYAQDAAKRGFDVVVAFGGDGTVNEAATGIARSETALGVLPGGSTNVFARTLGFTNDPVPATRQLVDALHDKHIEPMGLGLVNRRYFCFHTGIGFDAAVVRQVEKQDTLKRWLGHPLFISAALRTGFGGYDRRQPHLRLVFPDGSTVDDGYFTVVLNTNPYTYLGNRPLDLSSAATPDRGLVALTFRTLKVKPFLGTVARALRGKGVESSDDLDVRTDLAEFEVEYERPFPYQVDGDYLGETRHLSFRHEPDALQLVLPVPAA